jgi:GT2 family glycosyltransferase
MGSIYEGAVRILDKEGHQLSAASAHQARPLISVVTPTHNRIELLTRTLGSLAAQEGVSVRDYEVIVVVDGDYDGTADALQQMTFPFRLTVIPQVRSGVAVARNTGWRAARGALILFLDDDIIARPNLLKEHLKAHQVEPRAVVIGRFSPDTSTRRNAWTRYDELAQEKKYSAMGRTEAPSGIRLYTGNVSMPKEALGAAGGFDHTLPRNEDVDLGLRLQSLGYGFVYAPAADGLHCGYHDFEGWRRMPPMYGRLDVAMYRDRDSIGGLETIVACYHDRHFLNRMAIRLAILRPSLARSLQGALAWTGLTSYSWRMERVSYLALSGLWNILYWTGVRDGFRGNRPFVRMLRKTRRYRRRPYQRLSPPPER